MVLWLEDMRNKGSVLRHITACLCADGNDAAEATKNVH